MNTADAICHGDIDGYDDEPEYRCDRCGESVPGPMLCEDCAERLNEFLANNYDHFDGRF